jgi:hypothetical protein
MLIIMILKHLIIKDFNKIQLFQSYMCDKKFLNKKNNK